MDKRIVYKYVSFKTALRILLKKQIKFSIPSDFNDPFDCYHELLKFEITEDFVKDHLSKGILVLSEEEKKMEMPELLNHLRGTYTFDNTTVEEVFTSAKTQLWISCFSQIYDEMLLWSHYGNNHKGICIGFNFDGLLKTFDFIPTEVKYVNEFEKFNYCLDVDRALEYLISTKYERWNYEKEIRIRTHPMRAPGMTDNGIVPIHTDSVSKIILGCNCNINLDRLKDRLRKVGYENIEIIKLKKSKDRFGFDEIKL
jgi:hypothetical protein